jgi:sodium:dicarboxylate symporter family protein
MPRGCSARPRSDRQTVTPVSAEQVPRVRRRPLYKDLSVQILVAMLLGVLAGYLWPEGADAMKPLGDLFIRLVRMLVAPIIFCTVVHGIASVRDARRVGRVAIKALIYFEIVTTIALVVGLVARHGVDQRGGQSAGKAAVAVRTDHRQFQAGLRSVAHLRVPDLLLEARRPAVNDDLLVRRHARELNSRALQREGAVAADAVRVAPDHGAIDAALFVRGEIVVPQHDIGLRAVLVRNVQRDDDAAEVADAGFQPARAGQGVDPDLAVDRGAPVGSADAWPPLRGQTGAQQKGEEDACRGRHDRG